MCRKLIFLACFVLLLSPAAEAADPSLVGCWKFDESSGTTAYDSSGNGNDGTLVLAGSAISSAWVSGKYDSALSFDGVDDYVQLTKQPPITEGFTFSAWVKRNGDSPSTQEVFNNHQFFLRTMPENENSDNPFETFVNLSNGSVEPRANSSVASTIGQWFFVTVTWDKTTLKIYVNGELSGSSTRSGELTSTTVEARIGRGEQTNVNANPFNGLIDEVAFFDVVLEAEDIEAIMNGGLSGILGDQPFASRPDPKEGTLLNATWVNLGWSPGDLAVSHDVYLGDNLIDVNEATRDSDLFRGNQGGIFTIAGFAGFPYPDGLVPGTTYYWRIDEVNDSEPNSPWKGDVWNFSIPPKTAYNPDPPDGAEFVDVDATFRWTPGFGAVLNTFYIGTDYAEVDSASGGAPQGPATYDPGTLELEKVYYWRVDAFEPPNTYKGDIWSFTTPGAVGNPQPANGAVDAQIVATLTWTPADNAASSELYFGADADAVKNATATSPEYIGNKALGSESYDPGKLALATTYHWRVDAVYPNETVKGLVWSFETAGFIHVDDFESYNDIDPPDPNSNRIFDKWLDGFGTTTNGAIVGNDFPPYAEQTIVHGGAQSMPCFYNNNNMTSEATLTLVHPRDWTEGESTKLSLWFRGDSANAAERMFVALGNVVVYHDDPAATQMTGWKQWVIDLTEFAGVDLTNVNTITIGFGTKNSPVAGGAGTMYFDDIRLVW